MCGDNGNRGVHTPACGYRCEGYCYPGYESEPCRTGLSEGICAAICAGSARLCDEKGETIVEARQSENFMISHPNICLETACAGAATGLSRSGLTRPDRSVPTDRLTYRCKISSLPATDITYDCNFWSCHRTTGHVIPCTITPVLWRRAGGKRPPRSPLTV
ncbi:hypothetical protein Bbelb_010240 [Branchiostoma belcheri]|nr:hypothetical protein Bbelb_010240 [Branchiostoma belcheri]